MDTLALISTLEAFFIQYGSIAIFLSGFIEMTPVSYPFPGGSIVIIGGFFAFGQPGSLIKVILAGWFGAWLSFIGAYLLGKNTGMKLAKKLRQEKNAQRAKILLERHGMVILTTSMMSGFLRPWIAYVAGTRQFNIPRFLFYSGVASLSWTSLMAVIGYLAGSERSNLEGAIAKAAIIGWVIIALTITAIGWSIKKEVGDLKDPNLKSGI